MKTALPLVRATFGFLFGLLALLLPFLVIMTVAVIRAGAPHGAPTERDYQLAAIAIGALTAGFAAGAGLLSRGAIAGVPMRVVAIAGAGAVTLLLITMMIVGEPLGYAGAGAVAIGAGVLASWVVLRRWPAPRPVAT